jgi:nucleotide-binding universal stress UspA family protein
MTLKRILLPVDGSGASAAAASYTADLAQQFGAEVHVLEVARPAGSRLALVDEGALHGDAQGIPAADDGSRRRGRIVARTVQSADPSAVILRYAEVHAVDLIVIGWDARPGPQDAFACRIAPTIRRDARCAVVSIRPTDTGDQTFSRIRTILLPTDLSASSRDAAKEAADLALRAGATLHLLHVLDGARATLPTAPRGRSATEAEVHRAAVALMAAAEALEGDVQIAMQEGDTCACVAAAAERMRADLVVLNRQARPHAPREPGIPLTERLASRTACPVWIARGAAFPGDLTSPREHGHADGARQNGRTIVR